MGDRTSVTLRILKEDEITVHKICDEADYEPNEDISSPQLGKNFVDLLFEEVNYGELPFLDTLEEAGIPFDSDWSFGDNYSEGCYYCRFDDQGNKVTTTVHLENLSIEIATLMTLIDQPENLVAMIKDRDRDLQVLPWDNQAHNAKLFRTKQLITE